MPKCKITVLKRTLNEDIAKEFVDMSIGPCESFKEGQEFILDFAQKPEGFCDWAWNDIYKTYVTIARGGNFSEDMFKDWMKDNKSMITCCTDGVRPVIFKVERLEN
mgnify:CR=1 FL=1